MSEVAVVKLPFGEQAISEQSKLRPDGTPPPYLFDRSITKADVKEFVFKDWIIRGSNNAELCLIRPKGTLYRANNNGGFLAYVAVEATIWSKGWETWSNHVNPPGGLQISIQLETSSGSPLWRTDGWPRFTVKCQDAGNPNFYQQALDPDLFELSNRMTLLVTGGTWYKCR